MVAIEQNGKVLAVSCQNKCEAVLELYEKRTASDAYKQEIKLCGKCDKK